MINVPRFNEEIMDKLNQCVSGILRRLAMDPHNYETWAYILYHALG